MKETGSNLKGETMARILTDREHKLNEISEIQERLDEISRMNRGRPKFTLSTKEPKPRLKIKPPAPMLTLRQYAPLDENGMHDKNKCIFCKSGKMHHVGVIEETRNPFAEPAPVGWKRGTFLMSDSSMKDH